MYPKLFLAAALAVLTASAGPASATTLIGNGVANGNFAHVDSLVNVTSMDGWTSDNPFWVAGNSLLSSAPFGPDTVPDSRYVSLHANAGTVFRSDPFQLSDGDTLDLHLDWRVASGAGGQMTVALYTTGGVLEAVFGVLDRDGGPTEFTAIAMPSLAFAGDAALDYELRFTTTAAGGDFFLDRVTLAVPEPAPLWLLGFAAVLVLWRAVRR